MCFSGLDVFLSGYENVDLCKRQSPLYEPINIYICFCMYCCFTTMKQMDKIQLIIFFLPKKCPIRLKYEYVQWD